MINWIDTLKRLADTQRFSQVTLYKPETVMEHTGMVTLVSLAIATRLRDAGETVYLDEVLTKAIIHDVEESQLGDIPAPIKSYSPDLQHAIETMEAEKAQDVFSNSALGSLFPLWVTAKSESSGKIVAFADLFVVLLKFHDEIAMRGNKNMRKLIHENFYNKLFEAHNEMEKVYPSTTETVLTELRGLIRILRQEIG